MEQPFESREKRDSNLSDAIAISFAQYHELVGLIYEGPMEPVPWASSMNLLRGYLKANWLTLTLRPASSHQMGLIILSGKNGTEVAPDSFVSSHAFALDPFVDLPTERVVSVDEVIGERNWVNSEFFKQFVAPYDIRFMVGADIRTADGISCRFRVCRPKMEAPFSVMDKSLCRLLLPHFKRAVHLHSHLDLIKSEREFYASAVDRMLVGTVIFDEAGKILKINRVAEEIFSNKDGVELTHGMLTANYANENRELQNMIKKALLGSKRSIPRVAEAMSLTRPSGAAKIGILVRAIPLSEWSEGRHRPAVAVFIRDPDRKAQASADVMRRLFDFTPSEAQLAMILANGLTLDEAADELNIRKNTARAHLRAIFSKTGVTRQTSLIHVLLNSVISLN